ELYLRALSHHEDFADIVAAEEEFDRGEITEEVLDVPVVEDALQAEPPTDRAVDGAGRPAAKLPLRNDWLHVENIRTHDVVAVARRVGTRVARVEKRQQHAPWL